MTFKVGDLVRFKPGQYRDVAPGTYRVIDIQGFNDQQLVYYEIDMGNRSGGYFAYRFEYAIQETTAEQKHRIILDKIKYLDKRYADRRINF